MVINERIKNKRLHSTLNIKKVFLMKLSSSVKKKKNKTILYVD